MNGLSPDAANVNFLIHSFAEHVPGVRDAIVVSADGLLMAMSAGMTREGADRFAAAASGLIGLAHQSSELTLDEVFEELEAVYLRYLTPIMEP